MHTFHILLNLDKALAKAPIIMLIKWAQIFGQCHCAQPSDSMTSFKRNQYPNAVIGARYLNAVIWLVPDSNPTLMQQSDWCKQHTTLHANIE